MSIPGYDAWKLATPPEHEGAEENEEPVSPPECNCPEGKCQPEKNIGMHCWRSGFDIRASDFPDAVTGNEA